MGNDRSMQEGAGRARRVGWIVGLVVGGLCVAPFAFAAVEQLEGRARDGAIVAAILSVAPLVLLVAWTQLRHVLALAGLAWRGLRHAAGGEVVRRERDAASGPFVAPRRRVALRSRDLGTGRRLLAVAVLIVALVVAVGALRQALTRVQLLRGERVEAVVVRPAGIAADPERDAQAAWDAAGREGDLPATLPTPNAAPIDGIEYAIVAYREPGTGRVRVVEEDFDHRPEPGERAELLVAGDAHQKAGVVAGDLAVYLVVLAIAAAAAAMVLPAAANRAIVVVEPAA